MYKKFAELRAERAKGENGFTLIELLVVVVILGVLIAIAIPVYLNYREGANDSAAESDVRNTISVLEVCNATDGSYPAATGTGELPTPPCDGQSVTLSEGTTLRYVSQDSTSYILTGSNSDGAPKLWCYNSATGGSVKEATTGTTLETASC